MPYLEMSYYCLSNLVSLLMNHNDHQNFLTNQQHFVSEILVPLIFLCSEMFENDEFVRIQRILEVTKIIFE